MEITGTIVTFVTIAIPKAIAPRLPNGFTLPTIHRAWLAVRLRFISSNSHKVLRLHVDLKTANHVNSVIPAVSHPTPATPRLPRPRPRAFRRPPPANLNPTFILIFNFHAATLAKSDGHPLSM
jgi:hypothetical protein